MPIEAAVVVGAELVLVAEPVEERPRDARRLELLPVSEPASRSRRRRLWMFQLPIQKSKSFRRRLHRVVIAILPFDVGAPTLPAIQGGLRPLCVLDCAAC